MTISLDQTIKDTAALVKIDSTNPGAREGACASWVRDRLGEAGLPAAIQTVEPGRDNIISVVKGRGDKPRLVLLAHLDTVPFGDGWSHDPLGGSIIGDRLYGRGSCDMKAGLALAIGLLEQLQASSEMPAGDVVLCATVDEESPHMAGAHQLVHGDIVEPTDQVLALEPTGCRLRLAQVGLRWLELEIAGRQCHAGRAHLGIDANHVMARSIDAVKTAIDALGVEDALLGPPRMTCGTLSGGVSTNVVPGRSNATFDVRLVPPLTTSSIEETVDRAVATAMADFPGATYTLSPLGVARPPVRASEESHIVRALRSAYTAVEGTEIGVGGPDGHEAYTDASMIAAITGSESCTVFGPGSSDVAHTVDEYVPVPDLDLVGKVLTQMVAAW